jgi:hypothetical protein
VCWSIRPFSSAQGRSSSKTFIRTPQLRHPNRSFLDSARSTTSTHGEPPSTTWDFGGRVRPF